MAVGTVLAASYGNLITQVKQMSKLGVTSAGRLKSPPHDDRKGSPLLYTAGTTGMRRSIVVTTLAVVMERGGRHAARRSSCSAAVVMQRGGRHAVVSHLVWTVSLHMLYFS